MPALETAPSADPLSAPEYFRLGLARLSWRECWRLTRSWRVIIAGFRKLTDQGAYTPGGFAFPRPLAAIQVDRAALPDEVLSSLERLERACRVLGFAEPVFHLNQSRLLPSKTAGCFLREPTGETVASLLYVERAGVPAAQQGQGNFFSRLQDGRLLLTSDQPARLDTAFVARHLPGRAPAEVYTVHQRRLDAERARGNPPVPVRSFDELAELHWQIEQSAMTLHLRRGLFVRMTPEEVTAEERRVEREGRALATAETQADGSGDISVKILRRLVAAERTASVKGNLVLLAISLVLFVAVASLLMHWKASLLAVVGVVLLVHEAGHFVAMRRFDYRNVRLFFIPFFGAATAGVGTTAVGWQRVLVSLAGPVPGIALGFGLVWLGRFSGNATCHTAGYVFVLLNAANLLPLLPLDGGQVLNETVFSRHPLLRAAFRVLAGAGLIAVNQRLGGGGLLTYLGVVTALSAAGVWRQGRVLRELRAKGVALTETVPGPGGGEDVQPEALPLLVAELRKNRQANVPAGRLVNEAVAIIRLFRSRPPSVAASVGLVGLYVTVCALTVVGILTVLQLSAGDVWNLRARTQTRREQAAHAREQRRQAEAEREETEAANKPANANANPSVDVPQGSPAKEKPED